MFLKEVRRLFGGRKLHKSEAVIDDSGKKFSIELRRERGNGEFYLLVTLDSGARPFMQVVDVTGLDGLAEVVRATQAALEWAQRERSGP